MLCALICWSQPTLASGTRPAAPGGCSPDKLYLNLTSDETWRSNMALSTAKRNLDEGYPVTIFLNVTAVHIAVQEKFFRHDAYSLSGKSNHETLIEMLANPAYKSAGLLRVIVCPGCLDRSGFKPWQLLPNVYLGGPMAKILHCSSGAAELLSRTEASERWSRPHRSDVATG